MTLKETQLFYLFIKLTKPFAVQDEELREVSVSYFLVLIIALMLSKIFSQPLMSISNRHNYKTFTKRPLASLLHCIENILRSGLIL